MSREATTWSAWLAACAAVLAWAVVGKKARAAWPPDPFNETGRFQVVERTPTRLRLEGATSPVTGLAFEHEIEITGERTVRMKTTATNGRAVPVSWNLWPNTRVHPEGVPYVPLETLAPGAATSFEQTFELVDYEGPDDTAAQVARLDPLPR